MYIRNDSEYNNSRVINYNRWSNAKEVDALVDELYVYIDSRKKAAYKNALKTLLLDLYQCYLTDKKQYIGYYRHPGHYKFKVKIGSADRYIKNPHITFTYLVGSADMLIKRDLVKNKTGNHFEDINGDVSGAIAKMRAEKSLVLLWQKHGFTPDMIHKFTEDDVIIVRDNPTIKVVKSRKTGKDKKIKVKNPFQYVDTAETDLLKHVVLAYNRQLDNTHIDCDAGCISKPDKAVLIKILSDYDKDPVINIDLSNKNVHRVFNNRSFNQGGRFYGAWWIGCPKVLRKYITINGEPTVELDYSGIHIQLLYAMEGINYAAKKEDAYKLDDGVPDRKLNKLILLTALNAKSDIKARDSVYDQLRKEGKLEFYKFNRSKSTITKKLALLKAKHPDIADHIAHGEGIKLQYLDSSIVEKLIMYGMRANIPILTIHDSAICQAKYADLIKDKMWQYYSDMLNNTLNCNIKYTKYVPHAGKVISILRVYQKPPVNCITANNLYNRYKPSKQMLLLKNISDDIIDIDTKAIRTNKCNGKCRHSTRIIKFSNNSRNYIGKIIVELVTSSNMKTLRITG